MLKLLIVTWFLMDFVVGSTIKESKKNFRHLCECECGWCVCVFVCFFFSVSFHFAPCYCFSLGARRFFFPFEMSMTQFTNMHIIYFQICLHLFDLNFYSVLIYLFIYAYLFNFRSCTVFCSILSISRYR